MPDELKQLLATLNDQDKVLIACNYELYNGKWDLMKQDLLDRLQGKPYVLQLGERIQEDLERVNKLQGLEEKFQIKLCDYVKL